MFDPVFLALLAAWWLLGYALFIHQLRSHFDVTLGDMVIGVVLAFAWPFAMIDRLTIWKKVIIKRQTSDN